MAKGLNVSVVSDTREFVSGIQSGVIKPLENVEESLEDVQRQGDQAGAKLEKAFAGARTKVSAFKDEQSDLGRVLSDGSAQTRFRKNTDDALKGAGESTGEFASEARQNIGETFSSFRGDVTDFAQIAQDTLGGLASSFEGLPAVAATAAGAAGIGLVINAITIAQQKAQATQQAIGQMASQLIQQGSSLQNAQIAQTLQDIYSGQFQLADGTSKNLKDIQREAKEAGVTTRILAQAYAGIPAAVDQVRRSVAQQSRELSKANTDQSDFLTSQIGSYDALAGASDLAGQKVVGTLNAQQRAAQGAKDAYNDYAQTSALAINAQQTALEGYENALEQAAGDASTFYNTTTKSFDTAGYIAQWQTLAEEIKNAAADIATSDLTDAAKQFLQNQAPEAQAEFINAYKAANPQQKAALNGIWSDMATANAATYAAQLQGSMPATINGPAVSLDTQLAQQQLAGLSRIPIKLNAQVDIPGVGTRRGQPIF